MENYNNLLTYTVPEADNGISLLKFLKAQGYPDHFLISLKKGGVTVNGSFHRMIDPVAKDDYIEITFPWEEPTLKANPALNIPILYEDDDMLIFNKPINILVHPASPKFDDAIGNYFTYLHPHRLFRPIGRLDRNTTGTSLVAKNRLTATLLKNTTKKTYTAIVEGILSDNIGTINAPLIRVSGETIKRAVHPEGQTAITHYQILQKLKHHTLVSVNLETGRTHQIRAHFSYIGHPLAGDTLYGGNIHFIERQALHCHTMILTQPTTKKVITVMAPLPEDIQKVIMTDI